jgi:hypothetical protein
MGLDDMIKIKEESVKSTEEKAGICYGCVNWPGGKYIKCDEGHNIKKMQEQKVPCYTMVGSSSYNVKDEWDNVETRYPE